MSKDRIFLLGVGCQKGGTSWLHNYLNDHYQCDMGFQKEYHIFDGLFSPDNKMFYKKLYELKKENKLNKNQLRRWQFYCNLDEYFNYFDNVVSKEINSNIKLTGDITPSYCTLPKYSFELIKRRFENKGFDIKIIFLLRDPYERIYSSVRMGRRELNQNLLRKTDEIQALTNSYNSVMQEIRTRYEITIQNLEHVFSKEQIHYEFYENLFNENSIREITKFLQIDYIEPDFTNKINVSPKNIEDNEALKTVIVNYYRDTYYFILNKFGEEVKTYWKNYRYLI